MFEKKSVIATAILAGLASGIALADEAATAPAADQGGSKVEKKNECKGKKGHKNECKGKRTKKVQKDACSGPNGCDGSDMKKDAKAPAAGAEKKAE